MPYDAMVLLVNSVTPGLTLGSSLSAKMQYYQDYVILSPEPPLWQEEGLAWARVGCCLLLPHRSRTPTQA